MKKSLLLKETILKTASGNVYSANSILLTVDMPAISKQAGRGNKEPKSVVSLYFSSYKPPFTNQLIALNTLPDKLVNNIAVMDQILPRYSSNGQSLISVSLIGDYGQNSSPEMIRKVKKELSLWYPDAMNWNHIKTYTIPRALPNDENIQNNIAPDALKVSDHLYISGDYLLNGSINAAMKSGRLAAEAIIKSM